MQKYWRIWKKFLETEATDFVEERKLTIKEIKRVGYRKFIKANAWDKPEDVVKWRTDTLEVAICPHCHKDFGVLDDTLGLCPKCLPLYDLRTFWQEVNNTCNQNPDLIGKAITYFLAMKEVRTRYLKKNSR